MRTYAHLRSLPIGDILTPWLFIIIGSDSFQEALGEVQSKVLPIFQELN